MTFVPATHMQRKSKKRTARGVLGAAFMCVFLLVLFFKNSEATATWVSKGLHLCATKLIPSLFPFMVVSSLMVSSGAGEAVFKIFERPVSALFGVGRACCSPIMLGWLCGFPIGARCASELYRNGQISKGELTRIVCISGTPSPAFLIGAVGAGMLGEARLGIWLYVTSILSCVAVGVFLKLTSKDVDVFETNSKKIPSPRQGFARSLTFAVTDSAKGMLYVCGFVVFFSAFLGALEGALSFTEIDSRASSLLFSFFEMTSGLSSISRMSGNIFPLCALASGWSGLSVQLQTVSMCHASGLKLFPCTLSHAAKALLCYLLALAIR